MKRASQGSWTRKTSLAMAALFTLALAIHTASADDTHAQSEKKEDAGAAAVKPADQAKTTTDEKMTPPAAESAKPAQPAMVGPQPVAPHPAANEDPRNSPQPTVQLKPGEVPKASFDTPEYNFGKAKGGSAVEHDFWFTNDGNGPLEILAVRPSCGCTTSGTYDRVVNPGESGKIPIRVNTGKFTGPVTKTVTVTTNEPAPNSTVTLKVSGTIWQTIEVTPNSAVFGRLDEQVEQERKLTIVNNTEDPLKLGEIKSTNPVFRAETNEIEPNKKYELTVKAIPPFTTGSVSGQITIPTGMAAPDDSIIIYASAFIPPSVEVTPTRLSVPSASTVQGSTVRQVYVRNHDKNHPLKITDAQVSNKDVQTQVNEQVEGMTYQIVMTFPQGYEAPPTGDKLTFKTGTPTMPDAMVSIFQTGASVGLPVAGPTLSPQVQHVSPDATNVAAPTPKAVAAPEKPADAATDAKTPPDAPKSSDH